MNDFAIRDLRKQVSTLRALIAREPTEETTAHMQEVVEAIDAKLAAVAGSGESSRFVVLHGGYEVHAAARRMPDGRYAPTAKVYRSDEVERAIDVPPPTSFERAHEAATHALDTGMRWVDEVGG